MNQMKIINVSNLISGEEIKDFIKDRLSGNLIFLKKVDKVFKLGVCKKSIKQERANLLIQFFESNEHNEFLFKFFVFSYLTEHFFAERTKFDDKNIDFFNKLNEVVKEFKIEKEEK